MENERDPLLFRHIDPGPTTGLAVAYWDGDSWAYPQAYQCDANAALALLDWLAQSNRRLGTLAGVEEFRAGTGAGARGAAAGITRAAVGDLVAVLEKRKVPVRTRSAAAVKPWASDKRLARAGLLGVTAGMPAHARDAMRHMLFCAVTDGRVPDPLSRREP